MSCYEIISYVAPSGAAVGHGSCPSGSMKVQQLKSTPCPGFDATSTIELDYLLPPGIQQSYHVNPGQAFAGTKRVAYLPDNEQGRSLLSRLKYAWSRGLTFTIGTSLTTGRSNVVTWSTIHHKTSLYGGPFGWPDPAFFQQCNHALDVLNVPNRPLHVLFQKESILYMASSSLAITMPLSDVEPQKLTKDEECSICLEALEHNGQQNNNPVRIENCGHIFHQKCIQSSLSRGPRCPICRKPVGEPHGHSPSGTLTIELSQQNCPGYTPAATTIALTYEIPSGTQLQHHPNPGVPFRGTTRKAYLPNNDEGLKLLTRLKYAWKHGLTFTVGTSLTTGQPNCVTWTSIHHKTTLTGGPHGFPDAGYIANCNESLDALHVPEADSCF